MNAASNLKALRLALSDLTLHHIVIGCLKKKVWCRKLHYFINGAIYQCNIFNIVTTTFISVCKVLIPYFKGN